MSRLKLTSPGILLILAVAASGAIFLLDVFYLCPIVDNQRQDALRKEAVRAEQEARLVLLGEQNGLLRLCRAVTDAESLRRVLAHRNPTKAFADLAARAFGSADVEMAWLTDPNRRVVCVWSHGPGGDEKAAAGMDRQAVAGAVGGMADLAELPAAGLIRLGGHVVVFAREDVPAGADGEGLAGALWLARSVQGEVCEKIRSALGGPAILVAADRLPPSALTNQAGTQAIWTIGDRMLAVAWRVHDAAGRTLGYFRAELPVLHIHLQASAARRMVLIVLSLSAGLVLLVILGTHILIAGPVVRLLKRLKELDLGRGEEKKLTRDLHGEPLILARRLESAFDKLSYLSKTDQLTGLANRRHFEEVLDCFYYQSRRYNRPLSLMIMDIDFFKAINDTGGHPLGDELLKAVASEIERACRKADLPARVGGDEFAVLLPETGAEDAEAVADRIRESVCERPVVAKGMELNVTLSIGIADLNAGPIDGPQAMTSLADRALYAAKELGRNGIVQAHDLTGMNLLQGRREADRVNVLCKKLAGLDTEFKSLFLRAVEEIVELLAQRNPNMADHARKVERYGVLIAQEMELPERVIGRIRIAATLHDIGMIAMPDSILLSPHRLNEQERQMMQRHPLLSVKIMEQMEFLEQEIPAVRYHHERYDGKGYPEGIAGAAIPLTARILAVADAFDAMTSRRTFREAKGRSQALEELRRGAGSQFDPAVVEAFLAAATRMGDELLGRPEPSGEGGPPSPAPKVVPEPV